jgi:enoyl-CoA hydratase/carnithine racemase
MAVERERRGPVLVVRMLREEKRNAVDRALADEIDAALNDLDDDPDLRVGVLTGTANVFSAGTDLHEPRSPATERGGEYGIIRRSRTKPVIAAVEGIAYGGGFEIVLACDLVVASTTARFGLPEIKRGILPACGGLFRTGSALPRNLANELMLTGDPITGDRAYAAGFVNVLTEPGGALEAAVALAQRVCVNAPLAVGYSMWVRDQGAASLERTGWDATEDAYPKVKYSEDAREGVTAFFEKRPPVWRGR